MIVYNMEFPDYDHFEGFCFVIDMYSTRVKSMVLWGSILLLFVTSGAHSLSEQP